MVYILLAEGFEETEALVPADLLRRAGIQTLLASDDGAPVTGSNGITVQADCSFAQIDLTHTDMLLLPGGTKGVENLGNSPAVAALVQEGSDRGLWLAAICAAPTLLARWGFLRGKRAVCYPTLLNKLTGAEIPEGQRVVVDGKLITGQAAGSAFDFGLALITALAGPERAEQVRRAVHYR